MHSSVHDCNVADGKDGDYFNNIILPMSNFFNNNYKLNYFTYCVVACDFTPGINKVFEYTLFCVMNHQINIVE